MRRARFLVALASISVFAATASLAASVSHEFTALEGGPQLISPNPTPQAFNLGVTFDHIDSITFSLSGTAMQHSWKICDINSGCGARIYQFDDWAVNVYKPGFPGNAVGQFHALGNVGIANLPLDDLGGPATWDNLRSGGLSFALYPFPEGVLVATAYWQLIPDGTESWTNVILTFNGTAVGVPPGDYNYNGIVDAADYTVWRDSLGSGTNLAADGNGSHQIDPLDWVMWGVHFGETGAGAGASASVPEPKALLSFSIALAALAALRVRGVI